LSTIPPIGMVISLGNFHASKTEHLQNITYTGPYLQGPLRVQSKKLG